MSVTIKYNGSNVATVEGGKTATLPVKSKKMVTDIIVTVPESKGEVLPDHTESDFTLQLANIASGELGVVYSSTEKVAFDAAPNGEVIETFFDVHFVPSNIKKDVEIFGVTGEYGGGGGASADDRVKYVTYMDRGAELIKYPVIEGDTARDPVAKGYIEKPTKEPTESKVYPFGGWSKTDGGAPDSTALQNVTEDRTVYAAFTESARKYTVRFFKDDGSLIETHQLAYGTMPTIPEIDDYIVTGVTPELSPVTSDIDYYVQYIEAIELEDTSWARISEISASGMAENFWAAGDRKSVHIKGKIGTYELDSTLYVYIIGFDVNKAITGDSGITFGTFKTADGVDVALCDNYYDRSATSGEKYFNMNHGGKNQRGGWKACDLRYDILGSTDVAPSDYSSNKTTSSTGYDASATCATNPVANTLMAALPADVRAVMKPLTVYTNNKGAGYTGEMYVTASVDYLPLLSAWELTGYAGDIDAYEKNKQQYHRGVPKKKYNNSSPNTAVKQWTRSPIPSSASPFYFKAINDTGSGTTAAADTSLGIAPIFLV